MNNIEFEDRMRKVEKLRQEEELSKAMGELDVLKEALHMHRFANTDSDFGSFSFLVLPVTNQRQISRVLYQEGKILRDFGNSEQAKKCFFRALEMREISLNSSRESEKIIDMVDVAYAAFHYAAISYAIDDAIEDENHDKILIILSMAESSIKKAVKALEIYLEEDPKGAFHLGNMYHNLAFIRQLQCDFDEAVELYNEAIRIKGIIKDERGMALTLARRGECFVELAKADFSLAIPILKDSPGRLTQIKRVGKDFADSTDRYLREAEENSRSAFEAREKARKQAEFWEHLLEKTNRPFVYDMSPNKSTISNLNLLIDDIQRTDDFLLPQSGPNPWPLFGLLDLGFLEEVRRNYDEVDEYLKFLEKATPQAKAISTEKLSRRIERITALFQNSEFANEQEKKDFAKQCIDLIRRVVFTSLNLARVPEILSLNYGVEVQITHLWGEYLARSDFLKKLKELALLFSEGCEFGQGEEKYTPQAIEKAFEDTRGS